MTQLSPTHVSERQWRPSESTTDLYSLFCARRQWTDEYLTEISREDHEPLKDIDTMVRALESARIAGHTVTIAPDFDMDGISSGVLGYAGLKELGFTVNLYIPDYRRGHDLSPADIDDIAEQFPETRVLLTCDGGVNSNDGIRAGQALGWQVLVTDHHQELEPGCAADITVNPCRIDETYALRGICGAHVLYQVLELYAATFQPMKTWEIRMLRLFAGLGTVSDVMPVLFENRAMVRDSLSIARLLYAAAPKTIPNRFGDFDPDLDAIDISRTVLLQLLRTDTHDPAYVCALTGFSLLMKAFTQAGKARDIDEIDEGFYGFYVAPTMNSPRRIGTPLSDCFAVFVAETEAQQFAAAQRLIINNDKRRELVVQHLEELTKGDQPLAPEVYFSSAPSGMYGLLANSMMQRTGQPVIVMNRPTSLTDIVGGSARAPGWFDVITRLGGRDEFWAVGHQQACGVKLRSAADLDALVDTFREQIQLAIIEAGSGIESEPDLRLGTGPRFDASLSEVDRLIDFVRRVETLRPFGHGFTGPVVEVVLEGFLVQRIGSEAQHVRIISADGTTCLWWNAAEQEFDRLAAMQDDEADPQLRVFGRIGTNVFKDTERVQIIIEDAR